MRLHALIALVLVTTVAAAADRPARRANVISPAWKADLLCEPAAAPRTDPPLASPVSFNSPELRALRVATPGASDLRDRVDTHAPRFLESHRLAAMGRRPLLRHWVPGTQDPFDFMTAPRSASGNLFSVYVADPERWGAVMESAQIGACPCLGGPGPGRVPDGDQLPGVPLLIDRASGGSANLDLTWSASCASGATDYAIYEGAIGSWFTHTPRTCSTGGALSATITSAAGSRYFLVVPLDVREEGSYGIDSAGVEHPPSTAPCRTVSDPDSCP